MAEALSSLQTVKGIEKISKSTESSVAESSVESPEKNVVTSPKTTRTGRRKQVREGSGVGQTVTPFTRRQIRVPVASVKTIYNTRLSARLLNKEVIEAEKKECVEAVKISSYCDVVSDNDFGEVSEEKNIFGSDNVGVVSSVSEIEQESESLKWEDAYKDLYSRETAATNMKSIVLENNGLQVDTLEAVLEMPSDDSMAVIDKSLHNKKDDDGVDLCLSKTDISIEVLVHDGLVDVGIELPVSEIDQESESQKWKYADKDLDSWHSAASNMKSKELENNGLQADTILEAVLEMPSDNNMVVIDKPLHNKKDDVGFDLCLSKTDISTKLLAHEGPVDVGIELRVSIIEQESESQKWKDGNKDLDSRDTSIELENNGLQVDAILEAVLEMPSDDNMVVIDKQLHDQKDDVGVDLCLSKTDISTVVLAHEGPVDVGNELPVSEIGQEKKSQKWKDADKDEDSRDTAARNMKSKELENMVVIDKPLHNKNDDVGVDLYLSKTDISAEVLAHEWSGYVGVESPVSEIEQERESLQWNGSDKDLDSSDTAASNMKSKVLESNVDTIEAALQMPSDDNMAVIDKPLHNKKDDAGVDLCLSKTDISAEVFAHGVKVFPMNTDNTVVETPTNYRKAAIPRSVDVGISFPEKEFQSESPKKVYGESLDAQVTASTDLEVLVLNGNGANNVGVDSSVSVIEEQSESLNGKNVDKYLDSWDSAATNIKSKVLENNGLQVDIVEAILEMPSNDNMAVEDLALDNKKDCLKWSDDVGVDLSCSKKDVLSEMLANEGFQVVPLKPIAKMPSHDHKAVVDMAHHKKKDDVVVDISLSEIDMTTEVLAQEVVDTQKTVVEMPIHETNSVEQVFSPPKNGYDSVGVHFTFLEGSDNVGVHFSLKTDENVDAAVTCLADSKECESLKEQVKLEISEKVNHGVRVQDSMIQSKSEKNVSECWSSAANNFVDAENLDISVKIQQNISCIKESGGFYDNEKGLAPQEKVSGKAVASDLNICSESYERTESSIYNNIGDDDSDDTDFFQHSVCSKQSDSKRKLDSKVLSCNGAIEFADPLEMIGSIEVFNDFSGAVTFVDELDEKDELADDLKSSSEAFDDNSCDTEAGFDFLESMQQDSKNGTIASCGSCTKEPAYQSDSPDSLDSSVGFSSKLASYGQLVSGNSLTKESRLHVARDVSYCFSGIKKLSFDESQQASEVKSPSSFKQSVQTCQSSAPPVLLPRKAKITSSEAPLILADYPFTQKYMSSGVRSPGPYNLANAAKYKPVPVPSTTPELTFKLKSNVSYDKENIEQNENKVELTKEKPHNDKKEFLVCEKSDDGLHF